MKSSIYNRLYFLLLLTIIIIGLLYPTEYFVSNDIGKCYSCYLKYILHSKESNPFSCKGRRWKYRRFPNNM